MAVVTPTTLNPTIAPNATQIPGPIDPDAFRGALNTYVAAVEDKAQLATALMEGLQTAMGNGALSGGIISAGAGLSVSVATLTALVGTKVETDAAATVGSLTDASTNYLFLRQNGTWTVNTTGTVPSDTSTHGDYLLWGTATTAGGVVTAVNNNRRLFQAFTRLSKSVAGSADVTLTTVEARNRTLHFTGVITGNINLIVPLFDGAEYIVNNATTGAFTLTVKGVTGTGIIVATAKTAILRGDGTNVLRVTADNP